MSKRIIVLVGPPCSGKSTVGKIVVDKIQNACYISSGDIARSMAKYSNTIRDDLNSGKLAPENSMRESISNGLYYHLIENNRDIVILDGFPRFGDQAKWLRNEVPQCIDIKYVMIHTELPNIIDRSCARGRSDDKSLEQRLDYYYHTTLKDLRPYINYIIHTDELSTDECAEILMKFIREEGIVNGIKYCEVR